VALRLLSAVWLAGAGGYLNEPRECVRSEVNAYGMDGAPRGAKHRPGLSSWRFGGRELVFMLRELAAEISKWLVGDLSHRDVAMVIRGEDGKDETTMIIPDPMVRAFLRWMATDMPNVNLLKMIVDSVYSYAEHDQSLHLVVMDLEGKGSKSVPLGGTFGARIMYRKMFGKDSED